MALGLSRQIVDPVKVIDNWVDTIVFTAIRRFKADEEFGFSFWDNEFIAMNLTDFNNGVDYMTVIDDSNDPARVRMSSSGVKACEKSIAESLANYLPYLKNIEVSVSLTYERDRLPTAVVRRGEHSKYVVRVNVKGRTVFDEYAGTRDGDYVKKAVFFMDPFLNSK